MCNHNASMPSPLSAEQVMTGGDQFGERGAEDVQRRAIFGRGELGAGKIVAVGLVDRDHVGELDDAFLERLQFVAGARHRQHEKEIGHVGDRDFRLADADGLDQHDVVARSLAEQHGLARLRRDAAERARRRRGTDESLASLASFAMRVLSARIDPPVRRDDGSTASTATLWPWPVSMLPSASIMVDLPTPGAPVMPTRTALPVCFKQFLGQSRGGAAVIGALALDQRDRARQHGALAGADIAPPGVRCQGLQRAAS